MDEDSITLGLSLLYLAAVSIFFVLLLIVIDDLSPVRCCGSSNQILSFLM